MSPTLASDVLELIEAVHRPNGGIAREFPLVFAPGAPGRVLHLEEDGRPVSACAVLPRELVFPGGRLRCGLIGSVTTAPQARGRGLATRLLALAERELAGEGAAFALLWADDPNFYRRRGYREIGAEADLVIDPAGADRLPRPSGVRPLRQSDVEAVHALYAAHESRVLRSVDETARLLEVPGAAALVRERQGVVRAYAIAGRGADLAGVAHEWGGETEDVLACLSAHLELRRSLAPGTPLVVLAPHPDDPLARELVRRGAHLSIGILGMGKALRADPLRAALSARATGGGPRLRERLRRAEADELLALLLPPRGEDDGLLRLAAETEASFQSPPAAFVWGLDSI